MSQQTNSGFNAPGFPVVADDPSGAIPCGTSFTSADSFGSPRLLYLPRSRFTASSATAVCHRATACARIDTSPAEFPASLLPSFAGASDVGVAHRARASDVRECPRLPLAMQPAPPADSLSCAVAVGHKP